MHLFKNNVLIQHCSTLSLQAKSSLQVSQRVWKFSSGEAVEALHSQIQIHPCLGHCHRAGSSVGLPPAQPDRSWATPRPHDESCLHCAKPLCWIEPSGWIHL